MIRRIFSDLPTFKQLTFNPGLNLLVAEKSVGATDRNTRNRAGKTSVLEIIHFLLGSSCNPESIFRTALKGASFGMDFDLAGSPVTVERTGQKPPQVVVDGDWGGWPVTPTLRKGFNTLSNEDWKVVLGSLIFGLQDLDQAFSPNFRQLFAYFARRERAGGFLAPTRQSSKQRLVDEQVALSFLLGLDWTIPQRWQEVRDRERRLEELKKALGEGVLGPTIGSAAGLRPQLVVAQDRAGTLRSSLSTFRVVEEYHQLEAAASSLTREIGDLSNENAIDRRYLAELDKVTTEETPPTPTDLETMYGQAAIVLPDLVRKRYEDVRLFHESVVRNRRSYLEGELRAAQTRIAERDSKKAVLDIRRSELMATLRSAGALEHFTALQSELTRAEAEVAMLKQKFDAAEALESGTVKLNLERGRLLERLHEDYSEQRGELDNAILHFERISRSLYEDQRSGSLTVAPKENGPQFEITIQGAQSRGVNNMQIFCFDMMLMLLCAERGRSPEFLIHDSHLFDGVDERQVGKALAIGSQLAVKHGFQYIVTMNTDVVPKELPTGFSIENYILPVRLTDAAEDGGLFGFRF
jgi:uncharacterized protein YydD (DUF2326 family)